MACEVSILLLDAERMRAPVLLENIVFQIVAIEFDIINFSWKAQTLA